MKTAIKIASALAAACIALNVPVCAAKEYDLKQSSYVVAPQLAYALRGNLKEHAETFVECEEEYGVNAILLSSVAALESGWGKSDLAQSKNNIFGWRRNNGKYMAFDDLDKCIEHVAKTLSARYLQPSGEFYSDGTTLDCISGYYSEAESWSDSVSEIADQITERCEEYEKTAPEFCCRS